MQVRTVGTFDKNHVLFAVVNIRQTVGKEKVLCAMSGGVDSSVLAMLLYRAIGKKLTAIFVDNGLLRKNEARLLRYG